MSGLGFAARIGTDRFPFNKAVKRPCGGTAGSSGADAEGKLMPIDVLVIAARHKALGTSPERHDLSGLTGPLRSHGGVSEQWVPLLLNRPTPAVAPDRRLRNFDVFDVALNYAQALDERKAS